MNKIVINVFVLAVILVFLVGFMPSYTSSNIDDLAYVIALGIDKGESKKFKISFQFNKGVSVSESGSSEKSSIIVNSVEADSIDSAINIMNAYMARKLNMSHCILLIFSEEVATNGISNEIYTLANDTEVRPSAKIIVSKNNAKEYIENSSPSLESLITSYYVRFPTSSKYTGYIYDVSLGDFFNQLTSDVAEPFAILGGINNISNDSSTASKASDISEIKSTNTSISSERNSENIGVAVFKEDKIIGELSALETLCLSIVRRDLDSFVINIPDPESQGETIDLMLSSQSNNIIKTKIVNNSPYMILNFKFTGKIYSMKDDLNYIDSSKLESISEHASKYLENLITQFLYKTSTEFKSDICGLGKYALSNFLTTSAFNNFNWKTKYPDSVFKVNVNTQIQSGFLIT